LMSAYKLDDQFHSVDSPFPILTVAQKDDFDSKIYTLCGMMLVDDVDNCHFF